MEAIGYFAFVLVGLVIGLLGGGGAILTVPVLVYIFGVKPTSATGLSLFLVGATALVGAVDSGRRGLVTLNDALPFALASVSTTFLTRRFLVPAIPETLVFGVARDRATMGLFGIVLFAVGISMLRQHPETKAPGRRPGILMLLGLGTGLLSGMLGAGGGFLIVPALVVFAGFETKTAIGTSMAVIAAQSLVGFVGETSAGHVVDWGLLGTVCSFSLLGVGVGTYVSRRVDSGKLKTLFAVFVLIMAVVLLVLESVHR